MADVDIGDILEGWPYDAERNIRRIVAQDGKERLQVRLPLGIEQYEMDGRPDGSRPEGRESYLDVVVKKLDARSEADRTLTPEECANLYEEGVLYYFRYLLLFQIGEYDRVIRDTSRNLRMFDLIHAYGAREEDKKRVDQYRPYVLRMLASSRALKLASEGKRELAREILSEALEEIEGLEPVPTATFQFEKERSTAILRGMASEMEQKRPPSEMDIMRGRLERAIEGEDYERAARLRDMLRHMQAGASGGGPSEPGSHDPEIEKHP